MPRNNLDDDLVVVNFLRKTYGATVAVDNVSLTVREGEIFGILGPNGAGKTTTVESIAGLRTPDAGTVRVAGLKPSKRRTEITSLVGVQLQAGELPDRIKAREALELYASFYPNPADPAELLERLGLTKVRDTAFAKLSGGQKQRLSIALALIGISFYRFGFWKGLLLLPLGVLPAAAAELLLVAQWLADALRSTSYHRPSLAIGVPGVLVASALGLYFGYLMLRPMALKPAKG